MTNIMCYLLHLKTFQAGLAFYCDYLSGSSCNTHFRKPSQSDRLLGQKVTESSKEGQCPTKVWSRNRQSIHTIGCDGINSNLTVRVHILGDSKVLTIHR